MDALEREKRTASTVALAFNVIGAGVKLAGAVLSGSVSLLSEATHSATDVLASTISFFGVRAASVPPDEEHPYGHGKIESLAGFGESILLIVIVAYVVWEAIQRLASGPGVVRLDVALVIMSAMMVGSFAVSRYVGAVGRRTRSLVLQSNSQHLMSDVYTSAGVVVALGLMRFAGWMQADAIIAIALAAWIGYNAQRLARRAFHDLIDQRLDPDELEQIRNILASEPALVSYHRLRSRRSGHMRYVDFHIVVPNGWSVVEAHELADHLETRIERELAPAQVVIHVDPYDSVKAAAGPVA